MPHVAKAYIGIRLPEALDVLLHLLAFLVNLCLSEHAPTDRGCRRAAGFAHLMIAHVFKVYEVS
jgi:hypothetical protein